MKNVLMMVSYMAGVYLCFTFSPAAGIFAGAFGIMVAAMTVKV